MSNDLLRAFTGYIAAEHLFTAKNHLLLAVSGGIDSVVLAELCHQAGFSFSVAHCNFQLRGAASDHDEAFVRELANRYPSAIFVQKFDTEQYASANRCSIQVAARKLRYSWFEALREKMPAGALVVTAHHADDNVETILMNFFKGTGIAGLRGMLPKQAQVVRPLLFARKADIQAFAMTHQLGHVEDASNSSDKYTRNYFRNQLIPSIASVFPQAEDNILRNQTRFRDIEILYHQAIAVHKKQLLTIINNEIVIPVQKLKKAVPLESIVFEIIREYGFTAHQVTDAMALLDAETGKYVASKEYRIIRNRKWLVISPLRDLLSGTIVLDRAPAGVNYAEGSFSCDEVGGTLADVTTDQLDVQLDAEKIVFPLLLRKYRTGDYFYPLGLPRKKKVGRFLSGQKMTTTQKENTWVLEMNQKILWVVGQRIDDRFKVTATTKKILRFTVKKIKLPC